MQIASYLLPTIGTVVKIFVKFIIQNHILMSRFKTSKNRTASVSFLWALHVAQ